jgi:uncharacterized protein
MKENLNNKISTIIKTVILNYNLKLNNIILFGSRASGKFDKDSDYDILVVIENNINQKEKMVISKEIRIKLSQLYMEYDLTGGTDLLINSLDEVGYYKYKIGSVVNNAFLEGISL